MATTARSIDRIAIEFTRADTKHHRELNAFARYCILRLERELGARDAWIVKIAPSGSLYTSVISVHDAFGTLEQRGRGLDGALAIWDAMCRLEQCMRESRLIRASARSPSPASAPSSDRP